MSSPTLLAGSRATTPLAVSQRPAMIFLSMAWPSANTRLAAAPTTASVREGGGGGGRGPGGGEGGAGDVFLEHGLAVGEYAAGVRAHHGVGQDGGVRAGQVPGLEERAPVDVFFQPG